MSERVRIPYRFSPSVVVPLLAFAACAGPRAAGEPLPSASPPQATPLPDLITFQADVAPIRSLAASDGFLWIGSDRGLRRVRLPAGPAEWVGGESGLAGHRVTALATDGAGRVLVATEAEIGRLSEVQGHLHYAPIAKLAAATYLGPITKAGAGDGIWAGTPHGLFFLDGRGSVSPIALDDNVGAGGGSAGAVVTSLDVDDDGRSVWVGVAGRGLLQTDAGRVIATFGPRSPVPLDFVECLGTAMLSNGTRIAVGRGARGDSRIVLLRRSGAEVLTAEDNPSIVALVKDPGGGGAGAWLLAGGASAPHLYALELAERGQISAPGALRFTPARKNLQALRLAARPDARAVPPEVTVAIIHSGNIFAGTRSVGVARLTTENPAYLPAGELALGARSLSVACLTQERCVFATGQGPGWIWDGGDRAIRPIPDDAIGGGLMALAGDGRGLVYFVASAPGKSVRIARLSSDGARWEPTMTLPVRVEGTPVVTFATLSPEGNMWMSVRDRLPSGQDVGCGVIELQLPAGRAIHHRPDQPGERRAPEAIPIAGDVAAVRFEKGKKGEGPGTADPQAVWFCTSLGASRASTAIGGDGSAMVPPARLRGGL